MVARTRTEPKSKYTEDLPDKLYMLVVECGLANWCGAINWKKIGKILGVGASTLHRWKDPSRPATYHKEFHNAVKAAQEAAQAGDIKRGIIALATPHKVYDRTFEMRKVGPTCPPKYWREQDLVEWADEHLDLVFEKGMSKADIYLALQREVFEQTEEKQVEVKTRVTEVLDVGAAKLALSNIGPENERWVDKKEHTFIDEPMSDEECEAARQHARRGFNEAS